MKNDANQHHRKSTRLKGYDYTAAGWYFVSICVHDWEYLFGNIVDGEMQVNQFGKIVSQCWNDIPVHFEYTELDEFVVMPNHFHGIVIIDRSGTACRATTDERQFGKSIAGSLSTIIGSFKSAVTRSTNILRKTPGTAVWQRNFYDRIIRNDRELFNIRQYIITNPLKWEIDREKPLNLEF